MKKVVPVSMVPGSPQEATCLSKQEVPWNCGCPIEPTRQSPPEGCESAASGAEAAASVVSAVGVALVVLLALLGGTVDVTVTASGSSAAFPHAATDKVRKRAAMAAITFCIVVLSRNWVTVSTITKRN